MKTDQEIIAKHYDEDPVKEWNRLKIHPFEFLITCHFIEKYIGRNGSILDVGEGPGRYSIHFAKEGHKVTLLDLSQGNISLAKKKARQYKVKMRCEVGNALTLPFPDASFDTVFLLGPMYHLLEEKERSQALSEAIRVLRPNGFLFVSFISLSGGMVFVMRECPETILSEEDQKIFWPLLYRNQPFHGQGFTLASFDTLTSMKEVMENERLEKVTIFGQESVLAPCEDKIMKASPQARKAWLETGIQLAEREEFMSFSEHFCYVAKKIK